ncbi:MAG TPA: ABC transporter ATP-binding protein [Xanthomonadaceae bacterium]|nr:ABC transporter ATP-binding protein [Xanthomonadaceae bacterium]
MIKLVDLCKVHVTGEIQTTALNRVNLEIGTGDYVAITGPSGCGKSTLLNILGMIDVPNSGEYWFEGRDVAAWDETRLNDLRRGRVGFIFQSFNLIEELSVFENVELAIEYTDPNASSRRERVVAILEKLAIGHRARHRPSQLSGGQQQRVAIARALVARPGILLADEPTGNLDSAHGEEVMKLLRKINDEGTTVVMVTHSSEHAMQASRAVHLLDGRILTDTKLAA